MRLKVKGDTFYLPGPDGGVYFRNNVGSFRMEGGTIAQWIEKLIPMFNGEYSMADLTDGLTDQYREHVYKIAEVLYTNGFVRDVSQDRLHRLPDGILRKYASQIEFLDSFGGSGAYRLQLYRQAKVLAVGSGSFFVALIKSLLESGLPQFRMLITDSETTNRQRISELLEYARATDPEVKAQEIHLPKKGSMDWHAVIEPFDLILYVAQESGMEELKALNSACRKKKALLPAMFMEQAGLAGPLVHPDSDSGLESAWRRIHRGALCKDPDLHTVSTTAEALLANVIVFEAFKTITGATESELKNKLFLLNLETLEGRWHTFLPHPLAAGGTPPAAQPVIDFEPRAREQGSHGLISYFSRLTSAETGIFHRWEEGDLRQLPLSQCLVQAADPLSEGAAELLPEIVCNGLNHDEARREAGLAGIEAYVSRLAEVSAGSSLEPRSFEFLGVGAGETIQEGVARGLQKCLTERLRKRLETRKPTVNRIRLGRVEDDNCRYYLRTLTTMQGAPKIGLGEEVFGFPAVWVGTKDGWYGCTDLSLTAALSRVLRQALLKAQNKGVYRAAQALELATVIEREEAPGFVSLPAREPSGEELQTAMQLLKRNRQRLLVFDLATEPFLKEELAGVFGVLLREEGSH
ncbi:putative thiazole-containing bacteriocin maturation protein [Paenibacillus thailandensis]|uniref:Thiazole-containing bacteriocin maturation protein n=1 Tax=Paenibacillus thailandensis TaxID=393250 RepID=A0ABW5QSM5_9BACL